MNWNDWEFAWRHQPLPVGKDADLAALHETFESKRRATARMLFARDLLEAAAGLVVAIAFALIWADRGAAAWPIGVAILLVLGITAFFVRERIRARRNRLGLDAPLIVKLGAELDELRRQRRLLASVWSWYLGPLAIAVAIVFGSTVTATPAHSPLRQSGVIVVFATFFAACFGFAWWLNQRAVHRQLDPRIAELEKLRDAINAQSSGQIGE